ncbi:COP23 domain-containing protein [Calothrix sp. 336/3]|uniref:COP23 domain-containing protein n=1 Tax=Calothrix sp. 336/3 TaxID=1337936 RepID=UPI0004E2B365|nr:COP23 domain-containing protein [Calothrix sp. 336/3]AKG23016.1 hypothetical protein IJ00_18595 [Calothrix sp. 336/3]
MSLSSFKYILLTSLGCSLFLGNAAFAQSADDVYVPTTSSGNPTTTSTNTPGTNTTPGATIDTIARFSCQFYNGRHTVMYQPTSQPGKFFPWASPQSLGGGWDMDKRCAAIAERLESYRPDGLVELRNGTENGYNTLCVTTEANSSCRIVLTVPPGRDPFAVRNSVFNNLVAADSGQQTIAVNTFAGRNNGVNLSTLGNLLGGNNRKPSARNGINLKPFLDAKDGGTGKNMRNGVSIKAPTTNSNTSKKPQSGLRLNTGGLR